MVSDSLMLLQKNEPLYTQWFDMCDEQLKEDLTENDVPKVVHFNECVNILFKRVTQKYFKMGAGQYLQDFRRNFEWKKSEAHRKKVLMKPQRKALETDKVKIGDTKVPRLIVLQIKLPLTTCWWL